MVTVVTATQAPPGVRAGDVVRPAWRRARLWVLLAAVVALGAFVVGTLSDEPGRRLDPNSAHQDGSRALAQILRHYGARVRRTTRLDVAAGASGAAVLVVSPDAYSDAQLRTLASTADRLVLLEPGTRASRGFDVEPVPGRDVSGLPECAAAGARAAGALALPDDAVAYIASRGTSCYGGVVIEAGRFAVLGSAKLLQNDTVDDAGVAALDVNLITADRTIDRVVWLLPGGDADGSGPASIWDLFPDGAYRAFWWLIAVGALVVVWRARRLGGVVGEPLPVVVRAAEVVEGHGRLYARAGARDRAAAALRHGAFGRIRTRLSLPRGATVPEAAAAAAPLAGWTPAEIAHLLGGPPPDDDAALMALATGLDRLEAALGAALTEDPATRGDRQ